MDRVAVLLIVGRCEGMELIWLVTGVIVKKEGDIRILELTVEDVETEDKQGLEIFLVVLPHSTQFFLI